MIADDYILQFKSISVCLLLAIIYVLSLYIWSNENSGDHPSTIKKRFCSVLVVSLIAPFIIYQFLSKELLQEYSIYEILGLRINGIFPAIIIPFLHTFILFLGPVCMEISNGYWKVYLDKVYWTNAFTNILWLRNHIVAPISEEFAFRACMMPLLLQSLSTTTAIVINPLLFGVAHLHHIYERLKNGIELKIVLIVSFFQFTYTTIFGIYSAYLFTKTGHIIAPIVAHALCNHMGFPDVKEVFEKSGWRRAIFIALYVIGLVSWILLLPVLFNPSWYSNDIDWKITPRVVIS